MPVPTVMVPATVMMVPAVTFWRHFWHWKKRKKRVECTHRIRLKGTCYCINRKHWNKTNTATWKHRWLMTNNYYQVMSTECTRVYTCIPYSAKFSRGIIFTVFVDLSHTTKINKLLETQFPGSRWYGFGNKMIAIPLLYYWMDIKSNMALYRCFKANMHF